MLKVCECTQSWVVGWGGRGGGRCCTGRVWQLMVVYGGLVQAGMSPLSRHHWPRLVLRWHQLVSPFLCKSLGSPPPRYQPDTLCHSPGASPPASLCHSSPSDTPGGLCYASPTWHHYWAYEVSKGERREGACKDPFNISKGIEFLKEVSYSLLTRRSITLTTYREHLFLLLLFDIE